MADEIELIDKTLAGDTAAFGELVRRYQDRLYNTLVHVVGSTEDARDVVQDALVQAFMKLETFHRTSAFYTWLYRIAFNLAISRRRRQRTHLSVEEARATSGLEPVGREAAPGEPLEQRERATQVREALAALADDHRAILVLREIDGYRYEEIAEMLELPIGTVRSRLFRARTQLREQLKLVVHEE